MSFRTIPLVRWNENRKQWILQGRKDGLRKSFYSGNPSAKSGPAECKRKYLAWLSSSADKFNIRFSDAWKQYIDEVQKTTSKTNYRQREQIGRLHLLPTLKTKRVGMITIIDWQKCINQAYADSDLSKKSLENIRGAITNFCAYARADQMTDIIPELKIPNQALKGKKKILQPNDVKRLLSESEDLFCIDIVKFIVLTGLRRGEALGLQWEDLQDGILTINRSLGEGYIFSSGKTEAAHRSMMLTDVALQLLIDHRIALDVLNVNSDYIFPDIEGQPLSPQAFYMHWYRFRRKHGYICSIHELRHTFISLTKNSLPLDLLQRTVGHTKDMDTYGVYGHEVLGEMEEAKVLIQDVFLKL